MTWNSILTVLTNKAATGALLDHAIEMARTHDSHLDAMCLGIDRTQVA